MFGSLEGARGLFEAILLTVGSFVWSLCHARAGMINVIILYTVFSAVLGCVFLFWKSQPAGEVTEERKRFAGRIC